MKIKDALQFSLSQLSQHDAAALESELLLAQALDKSRTFLATWPETILTAPQERLFKQLVTRRQHGEPIAYILERREFWDITLRVTPATLIPRPETELLVETALQQIPNTADWNILDLGTGSGAIALAIAKHRPSCQVTATDASEEALTVAQENAARLGLTNVIFHCGNWFAGLAGQRFEVIASNPPYVAADDPHLKQGDLRFEPSTALSAGPDGLEDIRRIIENSPRYLTSGGWLMLEHGYDQGDRIRRLLTSRGFTHVSGQEDLAGIQRLSYGQVERESG